MRQLAPSVYLHQDTCNVYVIRSGREAVLIDFGDGSVLEALAEIGVHHVTDVLMTHHHRDQGQGLARAVKAGARIWVPHAEQDLFHSVNEHWQAREIYNNYNNREDKFSLLESVPVAGTLKDYGQYWFGGITYTVVPTPGHTTGSLTLLADIDGKRLAFTGDLIYGPGKVWSLAATQWSYNGGEGIPGTVLSLLDLKDRQPDQLLPSHGEPMGVEAVDPTVEKLAALRMLRRQNPRLFLLRETPFERITPHLLKNRTSFSDAYVLLSESGKALFIDFGYDFFFGQPSGSDRASRRPWLYNLPTLKRDFGVTSIDVVLPTHYHDDHVAGFNVLRDTEGTKVWAPYLFADVLERPNRYDLPCIWYDPIPVDRRLPVGQPIEWEEYTITLWPLSGHTYYAVAIEFVVDGKKVLVTGDQEGDNDGLMLNYVYKNGFRIGDYSESAALYKRLRPDLMLRGHWGPIVVTDEYLDALEQRGQELEQFHRDLLAPEMAGFDGAGFGARIRPYQVDAIAGRSFHMDVQIRNPFDRPEEGRVDLVMPPGWSASPDYAVVFLDPHETALVSFSVTPPKGIKARRVRLAADLTVGGRRFGQQAEALVSVSQGEE